MLDQLTGFNDLRVISPSSLVVRGRDGDGGGEHLPFIHTTIRQMKVRVMPTKLTGGEGQEWW